MNRQTLLFLQRHHNVASLAELRELGLTNTQINRFVEAGTLERRGPRAYRLVGGRESYESACRLACASYRHGIISGRAAGKLWGLRRMGDAPVTVTVPEDVRVVPDADLLVKRSRNIGKEDTIERVDGIRVTTPERTAFDLGAYIDELALTSIVEQLLDRGLVTLASLRSVVGRLARQGRAGSGRLAAVLDARGSAVPLQSDLEVRFERALLDFGLPKPRRQYPLRLPDGRRVFADFAWPDLLLIVEVDGDYHDGFDQRGRDKERDRQLGVLGWFTARVPGHEVNERPRSAVMDVAAIMDTRRRLLGRELPKVPRGDANGTET
ncbi:MAG: type IV toxin-antitoxin system AbiEi family antitoxin domain-containing protein [Acidimicrobiia bacterium]